MKYGVCCAPAVTAIAAGMSYDFAEGSVGGVLKPRETREAFLAGLAEVR